MNNYLIAVIQLYLLCLVSSRLLIGKHLIVSNNYEIILKSKFRFTDILMSNATRSLIITPSKHNTITELPNVPLRHQGRLQSKYHKINQTLAVYLIQKAVDRQQLLSQFQRAQQNQQKYDFYLVPEEFTKQISQINQTQTVCFYEREIHKSAISSILSKCSLIEHQNQQLQDYYNPPKPTKEFLQANQYQIFILLGCSFILGGIFTSIKLLIYYRINKNSSGI